MAIARGSRSSIAWKEETVYATAPGGDWNALPLNSETLDENINTVQGEDIRPDRANASMRGGNIATGGNIVADLGPARNLTFMKHMLAGSIISCPVVHANTPSAVDSVPYTLGQLVKATTVLWECSQAGTASTGLAAALTGTSEVTSGGAKFIYRGNAAVADSTAYTKGTIVTAATNKRWVCIVAGTTSTGVAAALIGTSNVTSGTATFAYIVNDITVSTIYKVGDLVLGDAAGVWICTRGGKTASSGFTTATLTNAVTPDIEIPFASPSTVNLTFKYLGAAASLVLYQHVITPGAAWPTGGLSIQKSIVGGNTDMFAVFRGCRINSLEISVPQEGIVKSTWGILAANSTKLDSTGAGTPVLVGEAPFTGFNCFVGLNENSVNYQGTALNNVTRPVREMSISMTNQADENTYIIGSRYRVDVPEGIRRATGRVSMYFTDATEYDWFKNESTVTMSASMIWAGKMLRFYFGEVKLTGSGTPKISGSGLMMADFEWTAFQESGLSDILVTALNDTNGLPV